MNLFSSVAFVGLGGALGACSRYSVGLLLARADSPFPYATLSVNVAGSFVAGLLATWFLHKGLLGSPVHLMLIVGFLGAFTTFSAFSVETLRLLESGNLAVAALNITLNVVFSLLAVFIGAGVAHSIVSSS